MQGTKTFDCDAAAKYARYWSGVDATAPYGVHVVYQDRYNGTFSRAKQDNNCTNFASQAMNAGGWRSSAASTPTTWTSGTSNPVTCCSPTGIHRRSRTARSTTPW
ncbi:amidase domain-containing protein [Streptomyces sp. NPDC057565]|uniref:amidase domain-containing protein n=1 Tax=Streptomyces sp. NPDC057565 TaxID=3346169 RepID=UPI00368585C8